MAWLNKRSPFSRLAFVVLMLFAAASTYAAVRGLLLVRASKREYVELQKRVEEKKQEVAALRMALDRFVSGDGIEIEARGRLNLQKPGEEVVIIVNEQKTSTDGHGEISRPSFWERIKILFR